jgi:serine phosphatase RsbU (regulator of sigma subunit)
VHVALVDVSGKGSRAAGRALQLSGALCALLDAVPADGFLEAANDYVILRGWEENFATAIHASLEPETGRFEVYNAGHHPAARWRQRDRRWELMTTGGPALGLLPGERYLPAEGELEPGDALLLFTDGLIERPGQSLEAGTQRLLTAAERLLEEEWVLSFSAGERLVRSVAPDGGDDRAVLLLRRDPAGSIVHPPAARRELLSGLPLDRTASVPAAARTLGML